MTHTGDMKNTRMHVFQDNFFHHSNPRFGAAGGLEHERQLLAEEQKMCKARARQLFLETNRRRKALEQKRRQMDMQNEQLKETILQQRRERMQDATERFQKAHLPPSQRRTFRRIVPTIEDALGKIQGTLTSYTQQSSFLSSNSNTVKMVTPPRPPAVLNSTQRLAVSAVEAYARLLQEQNSAAFKNHQEAEGMHDKQEPYSSQESHLSDRCDSESPLSTDSLEIEDHSTNNLERSHSLFDDSGTEKTLKNPENHRDLFPTSDVAKSSALLLDAYVSQSERPEQKKPGTSGEINNNKDISKNAASLELKSATRSESGLKNCNLLMLCEIIDSQHFEKGTRDKNSVTNGIKAALDSSYLKQESLVDLTQQRVHDDRQLSATDIHFPTKNGNGKEMLYTISPKTNVFLNDSNMDNTLHSGTHYPLSSYRSEPSAFINNLNHFINCEPKAEKTINTAMLRHASSSNIPSDVQKCTERPEETKERLPLSVGTSRSAREVRFIKGILKKKSQYMPHDGTHGSDLGHLSFARQVALAIRDSVELTRVKVKDVGSNNIIKKKLRWFDGVHVEVGDEERMRAAMSSTLAQSKRNPEDLQLCLTTVSGAYKPVPIMTSAVSSAYHFTKKAWADVGVQVSSPQERADEVKVQCCTRTVGPKVPPREFSARAGAAPVSAPARKGTIIRPQSATGVNQIAKTQGKMMAPRPPPRTEPVVEKKPFGTGPPCGVGQTGVICKQAPAVVEQARQKDTSLCTRHFIRTDSTVMYTPLPPSHTRPVPEVNTKGRISSGHLESQACSKRRGTVFDEKGLCLDSTPTDEEISELWHSIRGVFSAKEGKSPDEGPAPESGRTMRKPCLEQSRQGPSLASRRLPRPVMKFTRTLNGNLTDDGVGSSSQLHPAEGRAAAPQEERAIVAATEAQTPGMPQQRELHSLSLEEHRILLSLDRLNQRLHCVQQQTPSHAGMQHLVHFTKEMKGTDHPPPRHRPPRKF